MIHTRVVVHRYMASVLYGRPDGAMFSLVLFS